MSGFLYLRITGSTIFSVVLTIFLAFCCISVIDSPSTSLNWALAIFTFIISHVNYAKVKTKDSLLNTIFSAFNDYKNGDISTCSSKLEGAGLSRVKLTGSNISDNFKIDTLYYEDTSAMKWVFFRTVDLGYLKNVFGSVTVTTENGHELAKLIVERLQRTNFHLTVVHSEEQNKIVVRDDRRFTVIDDRWSESVKNVFNSFYTYTIYIYDGMVDISVEEIVPKNYQVDVKYNQFSYNSSLY